MIDNNTVKNETNKLQEIARCFWESGVSERSTDDFWKDIEWRTGNGGGSLITADEAEAIVDGLSESIVDEILQGAEYQWCNLWLYGVRAIWLMLQSLNGADVKRGKLKIEPLVNVCRNAWIMD